MMVFSSRSLIKVCFLILFFAILCGILFSATGVFNKNNEITVIVDAGHGAPDGGAIGVNGTLEKDVNLAIAQKTTEVLLGKQISVIMSREGDEGLFETVDGTLRQKKREDMNNRLSLMTENTADLFISIHMNSFENPSASGLHIFYSHNHEEIEPLAKKIQERISQITGADTHAVKYADKNLFLMKSPPIPAILVECGFISNPDEEKKLNDEEYRSKIAWAIAESIEEYYFG